MANSEDPSKDKEGSEGSKNSSLCSNCGVLCTQVQSTPKGNMCNTCYSHWKRTGSMRPTMGPAKPRDRHGHSAMLRHKRKPPRGMYINHDDLEAMASGPAGQGEQMLKAMDREIISLKRQVQNNKQVLSALKRKSSDGIDCLRPLDTNNRINARWTNDELLLAVQGMRKYGKDFRAIAEVIGTKTEAHLRTFFVNYRRRYNLDAVLVEYEAEHGPITDPEEKLEIEGVSAACDGSTVNSGIGATSGSSSPTPIPATPVSSVSASVTTSAPTSCSSSTASKASTVNNNLKPTVATK